MATRVRIPAPPQGWPKLPTRFRWIAWVLVAPVAALITAALWRDEGLPGVWWVFGLTLVIPLLVGFGIFAGNASVGALGVSFPFRTVWWNDVLRFVESDGSGRPADLRDTDARTHVHVIDRRGRRRRLANLSGSSATKVRRNTALVNLLNDHLRRHLPTPLLVFPVQLRADARTALRYVGGAVYAVAAALFSWFVADGPVGRWVMLGLFGLLALGALGMLWDALFRRAVVTPRELVVRRLTSRRRIPLEQVERFQERPYQAHLVSGETIPLGGHDHAGVVPGLNQYLAHLRSGGSR